MSEPCNADLGAEGRRARLRDIVGSLLASRNIARRVTDDETLAEAGLSSTDMVSLLLGIEAAFNIEVPATDITPDVFRSIATIDAMVAAQLQAS